MTSAIVLAGGSSRRMGPGVDKLMLIARGKSLLAHTLIAFQSCPDVDEIILVSHSDRIETYRRLSIEHGITKLRSLVPGGTERQDSVWCGLQAVSKESDIVLIHDGARALVTPKIITECVKAARSKGAAIPATPVKDTIKQADHQTSDAFVPITATLDRSRLWAAQTPQTFRTDLIRLAYEPLIRAKDIVTDDAAAAERAGHHVFLVPSDPLNLKVTTPEDLILAEAILSHRKSFS